VSVLQAFSGVLGEVVGGLLPVSPVNALFVAIDILLVARPLNTLYNQFACDE